MAGADSQSGKITIVLADDHTMVRQGLRTVLEAEKDFSIIGEAGDGLEALRLAEKLSPQVLIADLNMPGINGIEVVRQAKERCPGTRIIILTMHADTAYIEEALRFGAAGYLLKESPKSDLVNAVRQVAAGRRYLTPEVSELAIKGFVGRSHAADPYDELHSREREVLHLVAQGFTNIEIGKSLFISPRTVEVHRASMMQKLGLENHAQLMLYAVKRGIIRDVKPLEKARPETAKKKHKRR